MEEAKQIAQAFINDEISLDELLAKLGEIREKQTNNGFEEGLKGLADNGIDIIEEE